MFDMDTNWWEIIVRSAVVYAALLFGLRLVGKRQLGQMTPFDLVVILLIANAVQNAMVGPDTSLSGGLLSAAVLLGVNWIVGVVNERVPRLRKVVEGEPALLISNGVVLHRTLKHEHIDIQELNQAARENGLADLTEVQMAVLEIDGSMSIVPKVR